MGRSLLLSLYLSLVVPISAYLSTTIVVLVVIISRRKQSKVFLSNVWMVVVVAAPQQHHTHSRTFSRRHRPVIRKMTPKMTNETNKSPSTHARLLDLVQYIYHILYCSGIIIKIGVHMYTYRLRSLALNYVSHQLVPNYYTRIYCRCCRRTKPHLPPIMFKADPWRYDTIAANIKSPTPRLL